VIQLADRPAQMGDAVEVNLVGEVNGETVLRQNSRNRIVLDADRMNIPGLIEAMVGMSAGEHKHEHITLPADFDREELRNLEMHTEIDMVRVNSRQLPEIGDELAQTVGAFQTLAELRADLEKRILQYKEQEAREKYANNTLDTFANLANISYPAAFMDDRLKDAMDDYKADVKRMGMPWDEWLNISKKTEAEMVEDLRPNTEARARRGLVMRQLAVDENLTATDEEANAEFERERIIARENRGDMKKDKATMSNMRNNVLSNKVIDRMVAIAKGEG
jgi:trigger factor